MMPVVTRLLAIVALGVGFAHPAVAEVFETKADHAILLDADTDTVLFQKDAEVRMPPASMAKLMTMAVVFDALKSGKLKLDSEFVVSENAWRSGGASSGGSGLGLAITRRLVELHGGTVVVSNRASGGALFEIELPQVPAP